MDNINPQRNTSKSNYHKIIKVLLFTIMLCILGISSALALGVYKNFQKDKNSIKRYTSLNLFGQSNSITENNVKDVQNKVKSLLSDFSLKKVKLSSGDSISAFPISKLGFNVDYNSAKAKINSMKYSENIFEYLSEKLHPKNINIDLKKYISGNNKTLNNFITKNISNVYNVDSVNSELKLGASGFVATPSTSGKKVDEKKLKKIIISNVLNNKFEILQIPFIKLNPKYTADQVAKMIPDTLWSNFSTNYGFSSPARKTNIGIASSNINGELIAPDEEFEFYKSIGGEPTAAKGFRSAPVYINGKVDSGIGGGMCQVSTTLYNAALRANLKMLERYSHALPVHYIPLGLDAAVAYGCNTLRFKNSTNGYIWLKSYHDGNQLSFSIYGHGPLNVKVKVYSILRNSHSADVYRDIYDLNNKLIKKEYLHRSNYKTE
jgi:vancomycin resistance protein YoaR